MRSLTWVPMKARPLFTIAFTLASSALVLLCACSATTLPVEPTVQPPPEPRANTGSEREVTQVLDAFHAAAAKADEAAYFALFARDGVFLGTDASERWTVAAFREYVHPHFAAGRGFVYLPRDRHVSFGANGQIAWFDELLDHAKYGELRGTGVLVREGDVFRIAQYNLTFTVPNDVAAQVVPLLRAPAPSAP